MVEPTIELHCSKNIQHMWVVRIWRLAGSSVYFRRADSPSIIRLMRVMLNIAEKAAHNG